MRYTLEGQGGVKRKKRRGKPMVQYIDHVPTYYLYTWKLQQGANEEERAKRLNNLCSLPASKWFEPGHIQSNDPKACHHSLSWFHPKASWLWFFFPNVSLYWHQLLEGDEVGGVSGTSTRSSMLHELVGDVELTQVVASHLWFDSHLLRSCRFTCPPRCLPS